MTEYICPYCGKVMSRSMTLFEKKYVNILMCKNSLCGFVIQGMGNDYEESYADMNNLYRINCERIHRN